MSGSAGAVSSTPAITAANDESSVISYARIKYLEGARRNTYETVAVNRLNKKFETTLFDKSLKYKLDGAEKVQLLHLSVTEKEMELKLQRKSNHPPVNMLQSASESEAESMSQQTGELSKSRKITPSKSDKNKLLKKNQRIANFAKLLSIKQESLVDQLNDHGNKKLEKEKSKNADTDNDLRINDIGNDEGIVEKSVKRKTTSPSPDVAERPSAKKSKQSYEYNNDNEISDVNLAQSVEKICGKQSSSTESRTTNKPTITNNQVIDKQYTLSQINKIESLVKEVEKYKQTSEKYKKENGKLMKKMSCLRAELKDSEADRIILRDLNYQLQTKVIESAEERQIIENQMREAQDKPMADADVLPIGHKKNNEVHLGNSVYLEKNALSNVLCNSATPSQFVGNLLLAKFSEPVLKVSTISGHVSNRKLGKIKKLLQTDDDADKASNNTDTGNELNDETSSRENKAKNLQETLTTNQLDQNVLQGCKSDDMLMIAFSNEKIPKENYICTISFGLKPDIKTLLTKEQKKNYDSAKDFNNFHKYACAKISNLKKRKENSKSKKDINKKDEDPPFREMISENNLSPKNSVLVVHADIEHSVSELYKQDLQDEDEKDEEPPLSEISSENNLSRKNSVLFIPADESSGSEIDEEDLRDDDDDLDPLAIHEIDDKE